MRPLPGMICALAKSKDKEATERFPKPIPSVISIAGSDSSGGAGIQADIKTISAFGLYAQTVITALTAQNTTGVYGIEDVSPEFTRKQIDVVFADIRPEAVKVGMVSSAAIAESIAEGLVANDARNIVVDPVMVATSGSSLMADDTVDTLAAKLFPLADLLTPNIPEAEVLSGMRIESESDMALAADRIRTLLRDDAYVLIKGGHFSDTANDLLCGPEGAILICGERIVTENSHGTGCSLSSAIACGLAQGLGMERSVRDAKDFLTGALAHDPMMGKGNGPLDHMWRYRFQ